MAAKQAEHPQIEQLSAFALGMLESAALDAIESHLAECPSCCDTLNQIKEDTFVGIVRQANEVDHDAQCAAQADTDLDQSGPAIAEVGILAESLQARKDVINDLAAALAEAGTVARSSTDSAVPQATEPAAAHVADILAELANHPRYRIEELIGTGGMGAVYKAEHRMMKRPVALKVINPKFIQSKQAAERFRKEVVAAGRLVHPNIVHSYDAATAGDVHFLVMEYVKGTDLQKVLDQRGPLPVAEACEYIRQAALGLDHAYAKGMVHRDVKPQNLMSAVSRDAQRSAGATATHDSALRSEDSASRLTGVVKILDFGLASLTEAVAEETTQLSTVDAQKSGLTQAGALMGTPDYMAPEQAKDARTADIRSDIYSIGCTLYALLSGKVPFPGGSAIDKVIAHSTNQPQPIGELRKDVPAALVRVLDRMMAKDPAQRYQTPAQVVDALAPFAQVAGAAIVDRARRSVRASAEALVIVGSLAFVCALGLAVYLILFGASQSEWTEMELRVMTLIQITYAVVLFGTGSLVRWLRWRSVVILCAIGLNVGALVLAINVVMEWSRVSRVPLWPLMIPLWLGMPVYVWTVFVLFRSEVREAFARNAAQPYRERDWFAGIRVGASCAGLLAAGIIFYWQTPDGIVRFEIDDPEIKVVIDNEGPTITGADKKPIRLTAGKHGLTITRGDFHFDAATFQLKKGDRTTLKVEWLPDQKMVVRQNGRPIIWANHRPAQRDEDLLQGAWKPISVELLGQVVAEDLFAKMHIQITVKDDRWGMIGPDGKKYSGSFKFYPGTNPKWVDVKGSLWENMPDGHGIVKVDCDTATVCLTPLNQPRPTEFSGKGKQALIVARRVSENDAKIEAATKAAEAWLKLIDDGQLGEAWEESSRADRQSLGKEASIRYYQQTANQVGKLISRALYKRYYFAEPFGVAGEFVVIQYASSFDRVKEALEMIRMRLEADGQWRSMSYGALLWSLPLEEWRAGREGRPVDKGELINSFGPAIRPITKEGVTLDDKSWRLDTKETRTFELYEIPPIAEECLVTCTAQMKCAGLTGKAYLERWCTLQGEKFFSKGLYRPLTGAKEWASYDIPFLLKKGQQPDNIRINVVIEGKGTVWIKDVQMRKQPMPKQFAPQADEERIQGVWQAVSGEHAGKPLTADDLKGHRHEYKGDWLKLKMRVGKETINAEGDVILDSRTEPKKWRFIIQKEMLVKGRPSVVGKAVHGIYRFVGDRLEVCITEVGDKLPTEFKATRADEFQFIFERDPRPLMIDAKSPAPVKE